MFFLTVHHELTIQLLPTQCTDYYLFVKYYSPLHVSSIKYSSSGGHSCIQAAYCTVTLYKRPGGLLIRSYSCVSTGPAYGTVTLYKSLGGLSMRSYSCVSTGHQATRTPLHVSNIKCSSSGGHSCIQAAYCTVTLYKSPGGLSIRSYSCVSTGHQATRTPLHFRSSSTHLQEDVVVYKQHMVLSLSIRVLVAC